MLECCICHKQIKPKYLGKDNDGNDHYWEEGNNALPIHDGSCCDSCNATIVIPARFTDISMNTGIIYKNPTED